MQETKAKILRKQKAKLTNIQIQFNKHYKESIGTIKQSSRRYL